MSGYAGDPMTERYRIIEGSECARWELPSDPCYLVLQYGNAEREDPRYRSHGTWLMDAEHWQAIRAADLADDDAAHEAAWKGTFIFRPSWPEEWAAPGDMFPWQAWADG